MEPVYCVAPGMSFELSYYRSRLCHDFFCRWNPFLLRLKRKLLGNCSTDFVFSWSRRVCSRNLCVHVFIHQAIVTAVLHRAVQRQVLFEIQTQVARISKQSYNVPLCSLTFPWPFDQLGHLTVEHRQNTDKSREAMCLRLLPRPGNQTFVDSNEPTSCRTATESCGILTRRT